MRKLLYFLGVLAIVVYAITLSSCNLLYPSLMLKTPRHYKFDTLRDSTSASNYRISPNDFVIMHIYTQDGQHLIEQTTTGEGNSGSSVASTTTTGVNYLVQMDGTVILPVIGKVKVSGLTVGDATDILEKDYSQYYIKPYILLSVTNRRVIVFPGDPGTAKVIPLVNNNTTLLEAIALAGGITEAGKAKQIKLIRGDPTNPQVYLINLATIDGIKDGNTILQANDIIYVTPQRRPSLVLLERISPILSALTTILLTIEIFNNNKL